MSRTALPPASSETSADAAGEAPAGDDPHARAHAAVAQLIAAVAARKQVEATAESNFATGRKTAEFELGEKDRANQSQYDAAHEKLKREYEAAKSGAERRYHNDYTAASQEYESTKEEVETLYQAEVEKCNKRLRNSKWEAQAVAESTSQGSKERFEEIHRRATDLGQKLQEVWDLTFRFLHESKRHTLLSPIQAGELPAEPERVATPEAAEPADGAESTAEGTETTDAAAVAAAPVELDAVSEAKIEEARTHLAALRRLWLPRLAKADALAWPFVVAGIAGVYPAYQALGPVMGVLASIGGATIAGFLLIPWLTKLGGAVYRRSLAPLQNSMNEAEAARLAYHSAARAAHRREINEIRKRAAGDIRRAERQFETRKADAERKHESELRAAEAKYPPLLESITKRREVETKAADEEFPRRIRELTAKYEETKQSLAVERKRRLAALEAERSAKWQQALADWQAVLQRVRSEGAAVRAICEQLFPAWSDEVWSHWQAPKAFPRAYSFGETNVQLEKLPNGVPTDPRLKAAGSIDEVWPALAPFPGGSLLIKASGPAIQQANDTLQAVMLRLLTALPPGKVRFTILDPVGLGQSFAAFMHLADYDEQLVNSRIWTESSHIEQTLSDLTSHMETVIQKYLRNEFETIEEYNQQAGEVAEPYRFVVAANFPANFSESAARRLISIVGSGPRCGVQALITMDTRQQAPNGMNLADLDEQCVVVNWHTPKEKEPRWIWKDKEFEKFPLTLAKPPDADFMTRILHIVGARAKEAARVQVPFEMVAPQGDWWREDSAGGVAVALGRAGATKLQSLRLGHGTSQHVLIAGRTGSGKSTLMHAMITNLALHYSPEQIELYLIDFKKGVEFKTYATHELPHARVIAIESEREFGLSVMQRLDQELKRRGDVFRDLGVQDVAGYRAVFRQRGLSDPMPRILLIVDEFQEFFVEDDRISQDAAQLLDRLVRQGRAFGIHIHLGSQTLGGAYSLARSTLGQMAIRIALQCSESDAHLILSEDNSAARLLSRPGEAIYNDSNGAVEGNHPFQIVWLSDERREKYLQGIHSLAEKRGLLPKTPAIVFEGNADADTSKNAALHQLIEAEKWQEPAKEHSAWLGEAIAIKDPTSAEFHAQSGSSVLLLGQQPHAALGILATGIVGLAAQLPADPELKIPRFTLLNGLPAESVDVRVFDQLGMISGVRVVGMRDFAASINEVAEEVNRRVAAPDQDYPPAFLVVYDLPRFRSLRRSEDDFGFSRRDENAPPDPGKQFTSIVRDGPAVGVHTLVWCDSLNNLNRTFDRQTLREFDMRILFQMSANDSSNLIDAPHASKLGMHRALFVSEEQGRMEKFRPYGIPTVEWLQWARERLEAKTR